MTDNYYENIRRFTSGTSGPIMSSHFKSQYTEPTHNIWGQSSLKPSSSIWGFTVQPNSHSDAKPQDWDTSSISLLQPSHSSVSMNYHIPSHPHLSPRQSITSLSSSISSSSSSLWGDDTSLFSPPLSPQGFSKSELGNLTPPPASGNLSPASYTSINRGSIDFSLSRRSSNSSNHGSIEASNAGSEKLVISCSCGPLYVVQFKGSRRDIFTAPGTTSYSTGDAVMVDADRGKDLGIITQVNVSRHEAAALKQQQNYDRQQVLQSTNNNSSGAASGQSQDGPTVYTPKQILSKASISEIKDLASKVEDEKSAVSLCNKKVAERKLDMEIVDAEYQWDRRKLTFFYTANSRVDFRDLVRELFRIYKTRIWMCATTARS